MLRSTLTVLLATALGLAGQARTQAALPKMPGDKPLPKAIIFDEAKGIPWVWVADKGCRPRVLPGPNQRPVAGVEPLQYLQACCYAYSFQSKGGIYLLLVEADKEGKGVRRYLGWVNARHVVRDTKALKDPATRVYEKVMLVNTVESIQAREGVGNIQVRLGPRLEAEARPEMLHLANILFVYGDTHPGDATKGHVLIGTDPNFNLYQVIDKPAVLAENILGWVPKSRTCRWKTREALEWDISTTQRDAKQRRKKPGKVFKSIPDALKALKGDRVVALFQENLDDKGVSIPFPYDRTRYPVLQLEYEHKLLPDLVRGNNILRRVGVMGGFVNSAGEMVVDLKRIESLKRKLDLLLRQVDHTEILFVIDDTESMKAWFRVVARRVEQIIADVRQDKKRRVRIAVTYYGDIIPDGRELALKASRLAGAKTARDKRLLAQVLRKLDRAVKTGKLVDADSADGERLVKELKAHQVSEGGDPREQVFHGIKKGIEAANFTPFARKIVIVIGDAGDHLSEKNSAHPGENQIVQQLVPERQSPIEFYGVQVNDPDSDSDARAFRMQMQTIVKLFRGRLKDQDWGGYVNAVQAGAVSDLIKKRYEQLSKDAEALRVEIARLRQGQWAKPDKPANTRITRELERMLKSVGADIEKLRQANGFQLFRDGYVWEKSREDLPQTRLRLLLSDGELDTYLECLEPLASTSKKVTVRQLLEGAIRTSTGELKDKDKKSFEDIQLKKHALTARSQLLKMALGDIPDKDVVRYQREMQVVLLKMRKLKDARQERKYNYTKYLKSTGGIAIAVWAREGKPEYSPRKFYIGKDQNIGWYWIDFDEEWP